jgi:hypothetical protein
MTDLILHRAPGTSNAITLPLPGPRHGEIAIRQAVASDIAFIDALQKKHSKMVGFMPRMQLENNIKSGKVLIAEEGENGGTGILPVQALESSAGRMPVPPRPVGYCIAYDKYLKREELGIVYQLNVLPGRQRGLIGASPIKAVFDRAAYGCKLFCCWCAQDLEANHFWESVGFVPLAFRTGSRPRLRKDGTVSKRERMHIFWQRRIREGDTETPYWFPSETSGGALKENRIVLPIPPGTHWSDAKPAVLPGIDEALKAQALPGAGAESGAERKKSKPKVAMKPAMKRTPMATGGLRASAAPTLGPGIGQPRVEKVKEPKPPRTRMKFKNDPKLIAAARELRDRYTEQINAAPGTLLPPSACGKYDVSRQLECAPSDLKMQTTPLLKAA